MDFLDPNTERRSHTRLILGYCLVALAIGIATLLLVYQSYGYSIDRQGEVTQSGVLFISSQPNDAAIYVDDKRATSNTDTRITALAGPHTLHVSRTGYRPWDRPVFVAGGDLQHFDYPFLFPETLRTKSIQDLATDPSLATQSPNKRWMLLGQPTTAGTLTQYDLKNPAKPVVSTLALPAGSFTPGTGAQTWSTIQWGIDNRHVLLEHTYTTGASGNREFIILDRSSPALSVNVTNSLGLTQADTVALFNKRTDQFYVYNASNQTLRRINGKDGSVVSRLEHILAFEPYSDDKILYVTDQSPTGKTTPGLVSAVLQDGQQTYSLRTLPAAGSGGFALSLAQYDNNWYVAVGSAGDTGVYIYKNPQSQIPTGPDSYPAPWRRLPVNHPTYLSFSSKSQFLLAQSGQDFAVYDAENVAQYHYQVADPLDAPQSHATWMDDSRLAYVSGGVLRVFDYDHRNYQSLVPANPAYVPLFGPEFSHLYTVRGATGNLPAALTSTPLTAE